MAHNVCNAVLAKISLQLDERKLSSKAMDPLAKQLYIARAIVKDLPDDDETPILATLSPLLGSAYQWMVRFMSERFVAPENSSAEDPWYSEAEAKNVRELAADVEKLVPDLLKKFPNEDALKAFESIRNIEFVQANDVPYLEKLLSLCGENDDPRLLQELADVALGAKEACPEVSNETLTRALEKVGENGEHMPPQTSAPKWRSGGIQKLGPFGIYDNMAEVVDLELKCDFPEDGTGGGTYRVTNRAVLTSVQHFFHEDAYNKAQKKSRESVKREKKAAAKAAKSGGGGLFSCCVGKNAASSEVVSNDSPAAETPMDLDPNFMLSGPLDPLSKVNIPLNDPTRAHIKIPPTATHFAWASPVIDGDFSYVGKRLPNKASLFLVYGGYVYFEQGKTDLHPITENGIGPGTTLMFSRPRQLPSEVRKYLESKKRFAPITISSLKRLGAKEFTFVNPNELENEFKIRLPYGAFAYKYEDSEIDNYFAITTVLGDNEEREVWRPV